MTERESIQPPAITDVPPMHARLFPPTLVPILRERLGDAPQSLTGVSDELLVDLLCAVFFAGLQTHEGTYYPVRVAFAGRITADVLLPEGEAPDATPMLIYRWSTLRFDPNRAFCVPELANLGVVTRSERTYTKVELCGDELRIAGLTREGRNPGRDPYLKVLSPRPGVLSIRSGTEHILDYEHGTIAARASDAVFAPGLVRSALTVSASNAGLGDAAVGDYLVAVRSLVREMAGHGGGGILVISAEAAPEVPTRASYRTHNDSALAQLLHYLDGAAGARRAAGPISSPGRGPVSRRDPGPGPPSSPGPGALQLRGVLRRAFVDEADRWISEFGGFTAMDGATILDCGLGLRGFGVVLPVARDVEVLEASDAQATVVRPFDLSTRGTRHRAGVTYARKFPGSVVFVASHDGPVSCLLARESDDKVLLWRLGSAAAV